MKRDYKLAMRISTLRGYDLWSDEQLTIEATIKAIGRLAKKHNKLAKMECNGAGVIRGQSYFGGRIDDWARREYGHNVKSPYLTDGETTIFQFESEKIERKILALIEGTLLTVEFQGDPRGATVRLFYKNQDIPEVI